MWHRKPKGVKGSASGQDGSDYVPTRKHLRLNCAFCASYGVPMGVSVNGDEGGDDGQGEGAAAAAMITTPKSQGGIGEKDDDLERIYLFDSGVVSFDLINTILRSGQNLLCNLREQVGFTLERDLPLSAQDRSAGITRLRRAQSSRDRIGTLTGSVCHPALAGEFREIVIPYIDRNGNPKQMRLLTSLLDVPAHLIAELYRHRWLRP